MSPIFHHAAGEVLNFLVFCLPTQSNLELPANSHVLHCRDFVPFSLLEQSFDNMSGGSSTQTRLRNPAVHVNVGGRSREPGKIQKKMVIAQDQG